MSNTNTGGPAFPQNTKIVAAAGQELHQGFIGGMTLRDYFASKAMQGLCAGFASPDGGWPDSRCSEHYDVAAAHAYLMADAMLKARN
jgi:hypothetical protein